MIRCVAFKGPEAIPVYRAGLEEPHNIQAGAMAVQFLLYHYSFRWTNALLRENLKHAVDGWARLLWLCKFPLPVSETREWGNSCTYPFSLKEITSELLQGDSFWVLIFKISFRNYFASTCGKFVMCNSLGLPSVIQLCRYSLKGFDLLRSNLLILIMCSCPASLPLMGIESWACGAAPTMPTFPVSTTGWKHSE